jgi:hypothetical protein
LAATNPNVQRWLASMKTLKSWDQVNEVFNASSCAPGRSGGRD